MGKHRKLNPGDEIAHLRLLENLGLRELYGKRVTFWRCACLRCGKTIEVPQKHIGTAVKGCGCWRSELKKPIAPGTRFGRLTVEACSGRKKGEGALYDCICDCGNRCTVSGAHLRSGDTASCGCLHDELFESRREATYKHNFVGQTSLGHARHRDDIHRHNTSGYRNVQWHKAMQKWCVRIQYRGVMRHLGYFDDIEKAARVAKLARDAIKADFEAWYAEYLASRQKEENEVKYEK